jgi:hypothetical protein
MARAPACGFVIIILVLVFAATPMPTAIQDQPAADTSL